MTRKEDIHITEVNAAELAQYDAFVTAHPKGHFMQRSAWAKQKPRWRWRAVTARDAAGNIIGSCAVLFRGRPWSIAYACRGPVCDEDDLQTLDALVKAVRSMAAQEHAFELILDPDVPSQNRVYWKELARLCEVSPARTAGFESIQPRFVFRLALKDKSEDQLLAGLSPKTRYNLRVAQRRGVCVLPEGEDSCGEFSGLMQQTGERDGFTVRTEPYFRALLKNLGTNARLYMARLDGEAVAGALTVRCGDKLWYLYGASGNTHRDCMPNYLLQWEMIRWGLSLGCRFYDQRGVPEREEANNPLSGLYRFKKGFGGDFTAFGGEMRLIEKPVIYRLMRLAKETWDIHECICDRQGCAERKH